LAGVLDDFLVNKRIITLDWELKGNSPKTKQAFEILKNAKLWDKKINLFLPIEDVKTAVSFANIPNVQILYFDQANAK
jgi:ribosomal protein L4